MDFRDYLRWPVPSCSVLKAMAISPARAKWEMDRAAAGEDDSTDTLTLGSAIHCAILEPTRFQERYARLPLDDGRLKEVKAAEAMAEAQGLVPLRPSDWDLTAAIREAVWRNRTAARILAQVSETEVSMIAGIDLGDGVVQALKFRPDALCPALGVFVDLKSTRDGREAEFGRQAYNLGYHVSAGMYQAALRALGHACDTPVLIAVEKTQEIEVDVFELDDDLLEAGRRVGMDALRRFRECAQSGIWPKRDDCVRKLSLPAWLRKGVEE